VKEAALMIRDPTPRKNKWRSFMTKAEGNIPDSIMDKRMIDVLRKVMEK
jgi:hypothetical protein